MFTAFRRQNRIYGTPHFYRCFLLGGPSWPATCRACEKPWIDEYGNLFLPHENFCEAVELYLACDHGSAPGDVLSRKCGVPYPRSCYFRSYQGIYLSYTGHTWQFSRGQKWGSDNRCTSCWKVRSGAPERGRERQLRCPLANKVFKSFKIGSQW